MKVRTAIVALTALALPVLASAEIINIDFGNVNLTTPGNWNNSTGDNYASSLSLIDSTGAATDISMAYTSTLAGTFGGNFVTYATVGDFDPFPSTATSDIFWARSAGTEVEGVTMTFSGFDVGSTYSFEIYAARPGVAGVRNQVFTVTGAASSQVTYDVLSSDETGATALFSSVAPNASGIITVNVNSATDGTNTNGYFYMGAMQITSAVPEPSTYAAFAGLAALGLVMVRRRMK